jgi:hypothetical protein
MIAVTDTFGHIGYDTSNAPFTINSTTPGSPVIVFSGVSKCTNNPSPDLAVSAMNADSMHFKLDDEAWNPWEPYATLKSSYPISSGGEGLKKVSVEFKDRAGNITPSATDSIIYDATAPACSITTCGNFGLATWPGSVRGTALDNLSGIKTVSIRLKTESRHG